MSGTITTFTAGDIVVSVVGGQDAIQDGVPQDNAASPITLEEINPLTGSIVGTLTLPETSTMVNGTLENAISGEYGSSSEGALELAGNGQSLVIAGYGVNDDTFNNGGASVYGTTALAQSLTIEPNGGTYALVPRVVADIGYNGTVDTSTALLGVFNGQNPRSVATVNGTTFYLAGQGVKGSTNQGVFVATDGASIATAINTSTDTRDAEIYNGTLYVSVDTKSGPTDGIENYGPLPTGASTYTTLQGMGSIILTAAEVNTVNAANVGQSVNLSPETFFFANDTTLYIADGGNPKEGGLGDGGLQKWTLNTITNTWVLDYTLSKGLNLTPDTASSGTSGLIGLTGTENANGTVTFFATTEGIADLDQTYLVTITDTLANTISPSNETFTTLLTAAPNTNVRGVAEAPSAPVTNTTITTSISGSVVSNGSTITVAAGGSATAFVVDSGGVLYVNSGGVDSGSLIELGGTEYVAGKATGDNVYGAQIVSGTGATATGTTVEYGGVQAVFAGDVASGTTVLTSGMLVLNGGTASNTVIEGGTVAITGSGAALTGALVFSGGGDIAEMVANGSGGIASVISNFAGLDEIDFTFLSTATSASAYVGSNTVITVTSGGISENFTFAGKYMPGEFVVSADGAGGEKLVIAPSTLSGNVAAGTVAADGTVAAGSTINVAAGGTVISASVASKGTLNVSGSDIGSTVYAGGTENVTGTATGDTIFGSQNVLSSSSLKGSANNEIIGGGGVLQITKSATASNIFVESSGNLYISAATVNNVVISGGTVVLQSGSAEVAGTLVFDGAGTLQVNAIANSGNGDQAVISGFGLDDVISIAAAAIGTGATLSQTTSNGNTIETISGTGGSETFTFAGTGYGPNYFVLGSNTTGDYIAETGYTPSNPNLTTIPAGASSTNYVVSSGHTLSVLSGGIATGTTVLLGGTALFAGTDTGTVESSGGSVTIASTGIETGAIIQNGGTELVLGSASLDMIYGTQIVSAASAVVTAETVYNGGTLDLFIAGAIASATTINSGGTLNINGRGTAASTMIDGGTINLQSPKAVLGDITFNGGGLINQTAVGSGSANGTLYGLDGVISGFEIGDTIILDGVTAFADPGVGLTIDGQPISGGTENTNVLINGITAASDLRVTSSGGFTTITGALDVISAGQTFTAGTLASGDSYTFEAGATAAGTISFTGTNTTLEFASTPLTNTIENFTFTDTIDLAGLTYSAGHVSDTYNSTTGLLTITSGAMSETLSLGNFPAADAADFQFSQDYSGGTDLMLCFYPGTRIATPNGDVTVENLSRGDMVLTENGPLPIRWIGTSQASTRFADPLRVLPIRIRAGALGLGLPRRDLLLSPDHAIFLDGILVQAGALVNGQNIIREKNVPETFTYYHVELATHELLSAEGVKAETFVDNVDRMAFSNWDDRDAPAEAILEMDIPRAKSARQLPRSLRDRLAAPLAA
jgi:autotransporter passenger strand-loop-strand repeat protein